MNLYRVTILEEAFTADFEIHKYAVATSVEGVAKIYPTAERIELIQKDIKIIRK